MLSDARENPWQVMDDWCRSRLDAMSDQANRHIMRGKSLNAPNYRTLLGEHRAYMAMRSFIHGSRNAIGMETRRAETTGSVPKA